MVFAMCTDAKSRSTARGSVLMEFIIVAPLYFLLLGGMFIVGDAALARIRIHLADHLVTWLGGDRRFTKFNDSSEALRLAKKAVATVFSRTMSADAPTFFVDRSKGKHKNVNDFCALYMGMVDSLELPIPNWISGAFDMYRVMSKEEKWWNPNGEEYDLAGGKSTGFDFRDYEKNENYRAYAFHRLWLDGVDDEQGGRNSSSRAKSISAGELVMDGHLVKTLNEPWISTGGNDEEISIGASDKMSAISRMLGEYGE